MDELMGIVDPLPIQYESRSKNSLSPTPKVIKWQRGHYRQRSIEDVRAMIQRSSLPDKEINPSRIGIYFVQARYLRTHFQHKGKKINLPDITGFTDYGDIRRFWANEINNEIRRRRNWKQNGETK